MKYLNVELIGKEDYDEDEIGTGKHALTTDESGKFWGNMGAGGIFFCTKTNRFLLAFRSRYVNEPHTWGVWGGAIDENETPLEAVKREITEETAFKGKYKIVPSFIFKKGNFQYHNFIIVVNTEFKPRLDWETESYGWFTLEEFPSPLHFGLKSLIPYLSKTKKETKQETKKVSFSSWVMPSDENLQDEYEREYKKHFRHTFGDLFPTFKSWKTAITNGNIITVTPTIRKTLHNASNLKTINSVLELIKTYSSYPKFRNEKTIEALKQRFLNNDPVFMPLIYEDENAELHVVAGDTRLNLSNILKVTPKAIVFSES